jgi:hypothetical protein
MEWYSRPLKLETISRYVREWRLTEREALLLRGTPSARGFRGPLWASLAWLEDFSPGVTKRWVGDSKRGWKRNTGPACEAVLVARIQGRWRETSGRPRPSSKDRCKAWSRQAQRQCWNYGKLMPDGTRNRVCRNHGADGAPYGKLAWKRVMRWDPKTGTHRKVAVKVRRSDIRSEPPDDNS